MAVSIACLPCLPGGAFNAAVKASLIVAPHTRRRVLRLVPLRNGRQSRGAWTGGQAAIYIKAQLEGFACGARRNDISQQMGYICSADDTRGDRRSRQLLRRLALMRGKPKQSTSLASRTYVDLNKRTRGNKWKYL